MKRAKVYIITLLLLLIFTGCSSGEQQNYVKNIFISPAENGYEMHVVYYDFSRDDEHYIEIGYYSDDLKKLGIMACEDKNFSFRLCENIVLTDITLFDNIKAIFDIVDKLRVSPSANIIACPVSDFDISTNEFEKVSLNPIYNFSVSDNNLYGQIPLLASDGMNVGAVIIEWGKPVIYIDKTQWQCINILTDNVNNINYSFDNEKMIVRLDRIDTYYCYKDDCLVANINMLLKDYKGKGFGIDSEKQVTEAVKKSLEKDFESIFNNKILCEHFNLKWYSLLQGKERENLQVKVNII